MIEVTNVNFEIGKKETIYRISDPDHCKERICSYIEVGAFVLNECLVITGALIGTPVSDLYAVFTSYCIRNNLPKVKEGSFTKILANLGYKLYDDPDSGVKRCSDLTIAYLDELELHYLFDREEKVSQDDATSENNYYISDFHFFREPTPGFYGESEMTYENYVLD